MQSEPLTLVVERDPEEPDDPTAWVVVLACSGEPPVELGAGYLHDPKCSCEAPGGILCDVGWLQEFISSVGVQACLEGAVPLDKAESARIKLTGRLKCERFDTLDGPEWDEQFQVETVC